jgi:hypothetical protein
MTDNPNGRKKRKDALYPDLEAKKAAKKIRDRNRFQEKSKADRPNRPL